MNVDEALPTFVTEARDLLQEMESSLLACEQSGADAETVNAIFRSAHTLKGAAGLFGLDPIVAFTHVMETALDRVRSGKLSLTADMTALMIESTDHLNALVEQIADGNDAKSLAQTESAQQLLARLKEVSGDAGASASARSAPAKGQPGAVHAATPSGEGPHAVTGSWHISLRFKPDVLKNGMDPLSFIRYLTTFGEITGIHVLADRLPAPDAMDPECCYLEYELAFRTAEPRTRIEAAFEFVREDCTLTVLAPKSPLFEYAALIRAHTEGEARMGKALVACHTLTQAEVELALAPAQQTPLAAVDAKAGAAESAKVNEKRSIRVEADKLDRLIDLIGELIVAGANTNLIANRAGLSDLNESASRLSRLVEEVRDSALTLRMVQIGGTFSRFHRIVRDVARDLGKPIDLQITGADTELDKTVVEKINDPLVHLIRNAMDHGIEAAEVRAAKGKPARATVRLNAYHDSGSVVIEVSDDGGGINRERVLAKAVERGLVEPDAGLTDEEVFSLIMEPGFSTAQSISNLSGRGVGMDVVKRNVEELRGSIEISSQPDAGTTVRIRLPLTLAIINGFLMQVENSCYVVPLELVEECVELPESIAPNRSYLDLRGSVLPFLRLRELFELTSERPRRESVVVVRWRGQRIGLVVDALLGELQAVIKPLGNMFAKLRGIAGSTILGSGAVALILDVPALTQVAHGKRSKQFGRATEERPAAVVA